MVGVANSVLPAHGPARMGGVHGAGLDRHCRLETVADGGPKPAKSEVSMSTRTVQATRGAGNACESIPAWVGGRLVPVEKLEVHRRGLRHKAVSVFVLCGDEILIQRRALGKYHTPGLWANTCCTHPRWGENAEDCAHRRLDEELGLREIDLQYRDRVSYRADVGGGLIEDERVDIFVARLFDKPRPVPNPDEVMDTAWAGLADLAERVRASPDHFTPWLRIYLSKHAGQIFA